MQDQTDQTLQEQKRAAFQQTMDRLDAKRDLQRAVETIHNYLGLPSEAGLRTWGKTYGKLLGLLADIADGEESLEFQSIIIPVAKEQTLGTPMMNAGITDCEIAKSCQISTVTAGAKGRRVRVFFCPKALLERLRAFPDVDDFEETHRLPALLGSPKQIEWARSLRHRNFQRVLDTIKEMKGIYPDYIDQLDQVLASFVRLDNAKDWIEDRDSNIQDLVLRQFKKVMQVRTKLKEMAGEAVLTLEERAVIHQSKYPTFETEKFLIWVNEKPQDWQEWAKTQTVSALNKIRRIEIGRYLTGEVPPPTRDHQ